MRSRRRSLCRSLLIAGLLFGWAILPHTTALAQDAAADEVAVRDDGANQAARQAATGRFRRLVPGVETVISPERKGEETFSRHDLVEVLAYDPEFGERPFSTQRAHAKDVVFQREIWALEFTFKPIRFVEVDIPTAEGRFERKTVWYMVYHVRHPGQVMKRTVGDDGLVSIELVANDRPIAFIPRFTLESWDTSKRYADRILPLAVPVIQQREDRNRTLLDSVAISGEVQASTEDADNSVWGVATWTDIDPATDHFSIFVQGLTNAYRWEDSKEGGAYVFKQGDPVGTGKTLQEKTLRLNFWRPSDRLHEHEDEIRYGYWKHDGIDRFNLLPEERVDYLWVYR